MRLGKWLINKIARTFEPELCDAVVGDVVELKMHDRRAVCELLGLVLRQQAPLWKTWRPWLALLGIVGPVGVLLCKISIGLVSDIGRQALVYWQYGVPYRSGLTETQELETVVCVSLAIICWSWVGGFVLGTLSGDTLYVNGTLLSLVWFCLGGPLWTLLYLLSLLLNALHLVPLKVLLLRNPTFPEFIFFVVLPLILEALLFLLPSLAGIRQARRGRRLGIQRTLLLTAAVSTLTALVTWIGGWQQIALEKWSEGTWNPGGPSWQERLVPLLVVSWPVLYLLAMLAVQQEGSKSKSVVA